MDLKKVETNVTSDSFQFNGTVYDLVIFLREKVLGDLQHYVALQLTTSETFDATPAIVDGEFDVMNTDGAGLTDSVEFYADSTGTENAVKPALKDTIDLDFSNNLNKFSSIIGYLNNIIKTEGVVTDSDTIVQDILNKFRELSGIVAVYRDFFIASGFTQIGEA